MTTCSLDTNLIVRFITNDIPSVTEKIINFLNSDDTTFVISDLAVTETVYVLMTSYNFPRPKIIKSLMIFLAQKNLSYNRPLFDRVFPLYLAHPKLSFNDCCLAVEASLNSATPLYTLDKKLAAQLKSTQLL